MREKQERTGKRPKTAGVVLRRHSSTVGLVFLAAFLMGVISGCGQAGGKRSEKGYALPEIMVIAMTEKNRYEAVCTEQIWDVSVGEEGENFEDYLIKEIRTFMEEMRIMNLLAKERGISLSAQERSAMSGAAQKYFDSLTEEDRAHMNVTQEQVQRVYEDYFLAEKLVDALTGGVELEVSDSEARVMQLLQAEADSRTAAENLAERLTGENVDFQACAEEEGLTVTERTLGRGEESGAFEEAAFSLTDGKASGVLEREGRFYVLYCVEDYDAEATDARKARIYEERRRRAFQDIYNAYRETISLTYSGNPWEELTLNGGEYAEAADFFEIYSEYTE